MRPIDKAAVRALQTELSYADPSLIDATISGPFIGLVAVEEAVVGYAIALPAAPAVLSELFVESDARRHGHGRRLVRAAIDAVDADRLVLTTPVGNDEAVAFYRDLGFAVDAELDGFYPDGTDALRLGRTL